MILNPHHYCKSNNIWLLWICFTNHQIFEVHLTLRIITISVPNSLTAFTNPAIMPCSCIAIIIIWRYLYECRVTMKQYTIFFIGVWVNFVKESYARLPVTFVTALINRVDMFFIGSFNDAACFNLVTIFVRRIIKAAKLESNEIGFHDTKHES